jgi:hypothetical protein
VAGDVAAQTRFLQGYFAAAGTDAGWAQLGPDERKVGRSSYDGFWRSMASASVSHVTAGPTADTVEATVRYTYTSGRVVVERQRLQLLPSGGRYLINDDTTLSSRTVSS